MSFPCMSVTNTNVKAHVQLAEYHTHKAPEKKQMRTLLFRMQPMVASFSGSAAMPLLPGIHFADLRRMTG